MKKTSINEKQTAFTLVELLAVIAIIALIAALTIPAFTKMSSGNSLANAANQLAEDLNFAQQLAIKNNRPTEITFYSYVNSQSADTAPWFYSYQIWQMMDTGSFQAATKVMTLPPGIVISSNSYYSTIFDPKFNVTTTSGSNTLNKQLIRVPLAKTQPQQLLSAGSTTTPGYFPIVFNPDGSASSLNSGTSGQCVTLYPKSSPKGTYGPAPNFITLVIDPLDGTIRTYQPGS